MANERLPEKLEKFISHSIRSVEQLEILLLLRSRREKEWTPDEVSSVLRSRADSVSFRLRSLAKQGMLEHLAGDKNGTFRYAPRSQELERIGDDLAEAYLVRRFSVINLIYSGGSDRNDKLQDFADAFKW